MSWGVLAATFPFTTACYLKKLHSKGIAAGKVGGGTQSAYSTAETFCYIDPFGAADGVTHSTSNVKNAEHCHRPEVSCGSVKTDYLICQCELTKSPFHHVPVYCHTPVLALHALELKQVKRTQKTILFSFIF